MKGLLVVDMQEFYIGENRKSFFKYDAKKVINSINKIISSYDKENVIYIVNFMKNNFINKFAPFKLYEGDDEGRLVNDLLIVNNNIFKKYEGDAFTNKDLDIFLKSKGIDEVEIVGIDGGGCVSLTALGAIRSNYRVTINTEGVGTIFKNKEKKYYKKIVDLGGKII